METLIARIRSGEDWTADVAADVLISVEEAYHAGTLSELLGELRPPQDGAKVSEPHQFAFALASALSVSDSSSTFDIVSPVLERLNQREEWQILALLAVGSGELLGDPAFCKYVSRAGEAAGAEPLGGDILDRALALSPDHHRILDLKAQRLEAENSDEAGAYYARALVGWARAKDIVRVEDLLIKLLEHPIREEWALAWDSVTYLAKHGEPRPMTSFLDLGIDQLLALDLADPVWSTLRDLLKKKKATRRIRKLAAKVAEAKYKTVGSFDQILASSGLGDADVPMDKALREFERLLRFAPGLLVIHKSFGVGNLKENDGETITIDFVDKQNHKMSLTIAERSLDILKPGDIHARILTEPDVVKKEAKSDPVLVMAAVLTKLGGEGSNTDLRKQLVPGVLTAQSWPAWWKKATAAATDDDRIDTSQEFRKVYRLVDSDAAEKSLLPLIQEKADLHANVEMIHRFLSQHPEQESEARRVYRPRLLQWLTDDAKPDARAHLLCMLRKWDPSLESAYIDALKGLLASGGDFTFTNIEDQQVDLLESATTAGMGAAAALAALPSRHPGVRAKAATVFNSRDEDAARIVRELYGKSPEHENRILGLVDFGLTEPDTIPAALANPWAALRAVVAIVDNASREPMRRSALSMLKANGKLAKFLAEQTLDEESRDTLVRQLSDWRTTDRHLFPIFDFLQAANAGEIAQLVQEYRTERSAELVAKTKSASDTDMSILMSRGGLERLRKEIMDMEHELKTELPAKIDRARQHGDLKENAEYHAAKDKQRTMNQRLAQLQDLISTARAIEDMPRTPGVAGPGTLVNVTDAATGDTHQYWILGEGDSYLGGDVISYRAPLGGAITGAKAGETVKVSLDGGIRTLTLVSVEEKLPATA